jgi:hypothetical protein
MMGLWQKQLPMLLAPKLAQDQDQEVEEVVVWILPKEQEQLTVVGKKMVPRLLTPVLPPKFSLSTSVYDRV